MRFAFGAGGTGGHIVPAIALADELQARGHYVVFLGNRDSMEEQLAKAAEYPFFPIRVQKLYRSLKPHNLLFPYYLCLSINQSKNILRTQKIDGVITTGGFVAGPVALASILLKIPCFLHESNSYPGLTTRHLRKRLSRLYISFDESLAHLSGADTRNLGIPIKAKLKQDFALEEIGLSSGKKTLLVTGGSQGSLAINTVISGCVPALLDEGWQIIWQTGKSSYSKFVKIHNNMAGLHIFDFSSKLESMMYASDLAITRAGAMTIAELEASRTPAILIPLPSSAGNHQYYNALAQEKKGIAQLVLQKDMSPEKIMQRIRTIDLESMHNRLAGIAPNRAAQDIVTDILDCIKER